MIGFTPPRLLQESGVHATRRRAIVLERLTGRERPVTAQQLHAELRAAGNKIGLTTIYRALHVLAGAGLLHVFDSAGQVAYRLCGQGRHHHLMCRICELVVEGPPIPGVEHWLARIRTEHEFTPERHRIEVHGVCGTCRHPGAS
jgi:Fur family ferric uptake transcriptional regulator